MNEVDHGISISVESGELSFLEGRSQIQELLLVAETVREVEILHKALDRIVTLENEMKVR